MKCMNHLVIGSGDMIPKKILYLLSSIGHHGNKLEGRVHDMGAKELV